MQYYELSSKKLHFVVTPDELRSILKDFHHVVMNTGVRKNYKESNPNDFLFTYDALYAKLSAGEIEIQNGTDDSTTADLTLAKTTVNFVE